MCFAVRFPIVRILVAFSLLLCSAHSARSDEDDDDPKAGPPKVKPKAVPKPEPPKATPKAEPAKVETPKAEPAKAEPKRKPEPVFRDIEDPFTKTKPVFKSESADPVKPSVSARNSPEPKAKATPTVEKTIARTPDGESIAAGAGAGRPIRVRLVDGSTVVGKVRAEREETVVVDCALGQLVIPRSRVATLSYDDSAKPARGDALDPFVR